MSFYIVDIVGFFFLININSQHSIFGVLQKSPTILVHIFLPFLNLFSFVKVNYTSLVSGAMATFRSSSTSLEGLSEGWGHLGAGTIVYYIGTCCKSFLLKMLPIYMAPPITVFLPGSERCHVPLHLLRLTIQPFIYCTSFLVQEISWPHCSFVFSFLYRVNKK